jgi:C4-dicarboxylate-specific signal transduction histidine kinase
MGLQLDAVGETGLKFYGKICAALTHEMKNALAIINENVGLLEDYNLMTQRGTPLTPERFNVLSRRMVEQVDRANTLLKVMNQFSHGVDTWVEEVDLNELLSFVSMLSQRFAAQRRVSVEVESPGQEVTVTTSPFLLQNLIWCCMDFAMDAMGTGNDLRLKAESTPGGGQVTLSASNDSLADAVDRLSQYCEGALVDALQVKIETDTRSGPLVLILPKRIPQ